ncbi:hypothetical protein [Methylomonas rivi]|uniref:Lipoprotein n=1 Tax=Methylomonas rivi TaxID=2952226 RepID=A0ABT1U1P1_9GAMM|nr:hypothetical protein [Methylomonas sp. WSC-6]MBS4053035.1 hypothetical protein [Methylomonas sp.]MCQ8127724.1 hypothetical protein [Methylomonas sp. WSC-6]
MKLRTLCLLVLTAALTACGHGFEGEYSEQVGSSVEFLDAFAKAAGTDGKTIVIGPDYIDTDGIRTQYKDIFVRESGSERYLVLEKDNGAEEAWKIADDDTLVQGGGLVSITLKRIKKQD